MSFIVQKALNVQFLRMRGHLFTVGLGFMFCGAFMLPQTALAREIEQNDQVICIDPKHRHTVLRPLTEAVPIRKKEKVRVRRVLM